MGFFSKIKEFFRRLFGLRKKKHYDGSAVVESLTPPIGMVDEIKDRIEDMAAAVNSLYEPLQAEITRDKIDSVVARLIENIETLKQIDAANESRVQADIVALRHEMENMVEDKQMELSRLEFISGCFKGAREAVKSHWAQFDLGFMDRLNEAWAETLTNDKLNGMKFGFWDLQGLKRKMLQNSMFKKKKDENYLSLRSLSVFTDDAKLFMRDYLKPHMARLSEDTDGIFDSFAKEYEFFSDDEASRWPRNLTNESCVENMAVYCALFKGAATKAKEYLVASRSHKKEICLSMMQTCVPVLLQQMKTEMTANVEAISDWLGQLQKTAESPTVKRIGEIDGNNAIAITNISEMEQRLEKEKEFFAAAIQRHEEEIQELSELEIR